MVLRGDFIGLVTVFVHITMNFTLYYSCMTDIRLSSSMSAWLMSSMVASSICHLWNAAP